MPKKDKNNLASFDNHNDTPFSDKNTHSTRNAFQNRLNKASTKVLRSRKSHYGFKLFNVEDACQKKEGIGDNYKQAAEKKVLERMEALGGIVRLRKQPRNYNAILNRLEAEYPHFQNVVTKLRRKMKVNSLQKYPSLNFGRALLLTGPPGTGKSSFLFKLSEAMNTEFYSYSCAASSNAFDLVGLSAKWGNGSKGKIQELLVERKCPNPIILLDEIEKFSQGDQRFSSIEDALYGLLEKNNAKYFCDEYVGIKINASMVNWFATANNASLLSAPIQDRFDVVEVRAPTSRELQVMIPNLYKKVLVELNVQDYFNAKLESSVIRFLSFGGSLSIRRIKAALEDGITSAVERYKVGEKLYVQLEDISGFNQADVRNNKKVGFIWDNGDELLQIH